MAHEPETPAEGSTRFASDGEYARHGLGTLLADTFDAAQAMTHARLAGWDVRKETLQTVVLDPDGVCTVPVADRWATVRTNPYLPRAPCCHPDTPGIPALEHDHLSG
jgi:hypothetical protein